METGNIRPEVESENSNDSEPEMDNDVDIQNDIVDCADHNRRQRSGGGNRYYHILAALN